MSACAPLLTPLALIWKSLTGRGFFIVRGSCAEMAECRIGAQDAISLGRSNIDGGCSNCLATNWAFDCGDALCQPALNFSAGHS